MNFELFCRRFGDWQISSWICNMIHNLSPYHGTVAAIVITGALRLDIRNTTCNRLNQMFPTGPYRRNATADKMDEYI